MKIVLLAVTCCVTVYSASCSADCDAATLASNIVNKGPSEFSVECDEEQSDEIRDAYNVICEGKVLTTFKFKSSKAAEKCQKTRTITCGDDCGGCDVNTLTEHVVNQNSEPLPFVLECDRKKNYARSFWKLFCDENQNGILDGDEVPKKLITNKCQPVSNVVSQWEINCGTAQQTRQCGVDLSKAQAIRNVNSDPLPVIAECLKILSNKKTRWQFTCDRNQNGLPDENEHQLVTAVNQERFNNVEFNCGTVDNCFACTNDELSSFILNKETNNPGDVIFECVETLWGTGKARYRYACDFNGNGVIDEQDNVKEFIVKQNEEGCTRNTVEFRCASPLTTTITTTTTSTTMTITTSCYNCFHLGTEDGNKFASLVVNTNSDPHPVTLTCLGPQDDSEPEDLPENQGRFHVDAHCDLNDNGIVDEDELTITLTGRKRNENYCDKVSPAKWEIDCGFAACQIDACNVSDVLSAETLYTWDENIPVKAECLGKTAETSVNKHDWRFYCDENNNGIFDKDERNIVKSIHKEKGCLTHGVNLICGKSPTGQCSPYPEFVCTREDVLTTPNTDWYDLNTGNKNLN